jgi:hypothetical protein
LVPVHDALDADDREALEALEARIRTLLPDLYKDSYETVQPISMGSAGLKYAPDGRVAWDEIWATFCDLAMAGGPPHKGTLLEPASAEEVGAARDRYDQVAAEISRGVTLVTELRAEPSADADGWIRADCLSEAMAGWLTRAIVMENVAARFEGRALFLPAGPDFRIEKEIKNVITVAAKTCHYWLGHMPAVRQRDVAALFAQLDAQAPLVGPRWTPSGARDRGAPAAGDANATVARMIATIERGTGLTAARMRSPGWLGVDCASVRDAIRMMRALVASNVLARREGTTLCVPVDPAGDPTGEVVADAVVWVHRVVVTRRESGPS